MYNSAGNMLSCCPAEFRGIRASGSHAALFASNRANQIAQPSGHEKAPDLSPDPGLPYFIKPAVRQHDRAELWAKWRDSQQINQDFAWELPGNWAVIRQCRRGYPNISVFLAKFWLG